MTLRRLIGNTFPFVVFGACVLRFSAMAASLILETAKGLVAFISRSAT
jgi:hypothetical protein